VLGEGHKRVGRGRVVLVNVVVRGLGVGIGIYLTGWLWGVYGWKVYGRWQMGMGRVRGK
jgi:hypothetical protein